MLQPYVWNCFWLIVPVLLLNVIPARKLPPMYQPETFSRGVPGWISAGEHTFRIAVFLLPLLMPLEFNGQEQKAGGLLYLAGMLVYAASWCAQISFPASRWSKSRMGFMAPACTPFAWLVGIGLIGNSFYAGLPFRPWIYPGLSAAFLVFHNLHAWLVFSRTNQQTQSPTMQVENR
jgi:hypothetical protein